MYHCPCCSNELYIDCCKPIHLQPTQAQTPEQLMRARYSAHVLKLVDFIIDTYHPQTRNSQPRRAIEESVHYQWQRLTIMQAHINTDTEGYVKFKAEFSLNDQIYHLTENSRFLKVDGQWFYLDGETYP